MDLEELQSIIATTYGERDSARGLAASVAWLCEEVGELAKAARKGTPEQQLEELGDVLAWTVTIAEQLGLSAAEGVERYAAGCPKCSSSPCACP